MNTAMNETLFRSKLKTWINHKLILAGKSSWYKIPYRRKAVDQVKYAFGDFLVNPAMFTVNKLAERMIKNEDLFAAILPVPGNPAYDNSIKLLNELLEYSKAILKTI